jgi:AraC family transcriptional regulator of adaptative response / DNA-3-methyladenine glycosylase II
VKIVIKNSSGLYEAFEAKDARFDGRFFVGISSTGIYCRPVCRAKKAKTENCTFYYTAAEAEQAGYRPCLLCRPELAPGNSITYTAGNSAFQAARMSEENCGDITLNLGYRPPYRFEQIMYFLGGRAITGIEAVNNGEYMRTVCLETAGGKSVTGWVRVGDKPTDNALSVTISETLRPVLPRVLARIRHLFDLYCDPYAIYETLQVMNTIRPGICILGTRLPGCFNVFEMMVRAVLGQQISVKAASTLAARIVNVYGTPVLTNIEGLTHVFPSPETIFAMGNDIENNLGTLGVIRARSKTIYELARALVQGEIDLEFCVQPEEDMKKLMKIRGIGSWTAQYIAMRAMEWTDSFLETDAGVKKALPGYSSKELLSLAEAWRPWRSYATVNLWNAL